LLQFFAARGEELEAVAPSSVLPDEEFPEEGPTPQPAVMPPAQIPEPAVLTGPPVTATAPAEVIRPLTSGFVAFTDNFDDEPTNPEERHRDPTANLAARAAKGTPALGSAVVRIERVVSLGDTPAPLVIGARARRPAPSFPYVVQEGSHPVQGTDAAPVVAPAATSASTTEPMGAPATAAAPSIPIVPATPLVPPVGAPLTAADLGATPEVPVSREDNQSLDEVIMAYLARGVDRDVGNIG
jgi:hypothetical protein